MYAAFNSLEKGWNINVTINKYFKTLLQVFSPIFSEKPTIVTLHVLREQGFAGDISVQLIPQPILSLPLVNQAIENEDYRLENKTIIMPANMTMASVNVVILPVSILIYLFPSLMQLSMVDVTKQPNSTQIPGPSK